MPSSKRKRKLSEAKSSDCSGARSKDALSWLARTPGRNWTVTVALPGSVMDNVATPQLKSYLASEIARAVGIFRVDEVVIFSESENRKDKEAHYLARLLQYLECPQYLRKALFPMHSDLRHVGVCRPLRTPHHLGRYDTGVAFREGVTVRLDPHTSAIGSGKVDGSAKVQESANDKRNTWLVDVGLPEYCRVKSSSDMQSDTRVTVRLDDSSEFDLDFDSESKSSQSTTKRKKAKRSKKKKKKKSCALYGSLVTADTPLKECGIYWGFSVRFAAGLSQVFGHSRFAEEGYDLVIGTSDRGVDATNPSFKLPKYALSVGRYALSAFCWCFEGNYWPSAQLTTCAWL